jgi:spore maturation protein CgeB
MVTGSFLLDRVIRFGNRNLRKYARIRVLPDDHVSFERANDIWCRSRISLNPMRSSTGEVLSIKSRTFDMGLSGTMMVCEHSPDLELYYEPFKEFIPFQTLDDCVEKVKYFLDHESERRGIARAYYRRTKAEHLWKHRIEQILKDAELA